MIGQINSRSKHTPWAYGWRELCLGLLGIGGAIALVLAATAPSQDPAAVGGAALARDSAAAAGAALGAWNELRINDTLLEGQADLRWSSHARGEEPDLGDLDPQRTPAQKAADAFIAQARLVAGSDGQEAAALLVEAIRQNPGPERMARVRLEQLRLAAADKDGAAVAQAWISLAGLAQGHVLEEQVSVELLGALVAAPLLEEPQRDAAVRHVAKRWSEGFLGLPIPRDPWEFAESTFDLRSALAQALLEHVALDQRSGLALEITRREALVRGALACPAESVLEHVRGAEGFTLLAAREAPTGLALLFGRLRDDRGSDTEEDWVEGALLSGERLVDSLEESVRARGFLPPGFHMTLDSPSAAASEADLRAGATRLPGTELVLRVEQEDPVGFMERAGLRARRTRLALFTLALLAALAGIVSARMLARSRALVRARTAFIASVSHELRTPLSSILLMAENLEEGRVEDESRRSRYHTAIRREAARLRRFVEDVLDLARQERGEAPRLSRTWIELGHFAQDLSETLKQRAAARDGELVFCEGHLEESAWIDPEAITRAAANLVENAVVHGSSEAMIGSAQPVEVRFNIDEAGLLRLSVRDFGPGLTPRERERAFEPFARMGSPSSIKPGAGLGLAIVREIARAHGGGVNFTAPKDGAGALVEFVCPISPST